VTTNSTEDRRSASHRCPTKKTYIALILAAGTVQELTCGVNDDNGG
jgi:hypothetical protein